MHAKVAVNHHHTYKNKNNKVYHFPYFKAYAYLEYLIAMLIFSYCLLSFFPAQQQAIEDMLFASYLSEAQLCLHNLWLIEKLQLETTANAITQYCDPLPVGAVVRQDAATYCLHWQVPKHHREYAQCINK